MIRARADGPFSGVTGGRAPWFSRLISGGSRSSRSKRAGECGADKPLKTPAREPPNERKGAIGLLETVIEMEYSQA